MKKQKPEYEVVLPASFKKKFIAIAGKETWKREVEQFVVPIYLGFHEIRNSDPESIRQAIMNIAYTGTTINPIFKEAYFFVRDGKCFLDFTYRGLIKIATSEGAITAISAGTVYSWDKIVAKEGTKAHLDITRNLNPPIDPDEVARDVKRIWEYLTCAYAVATYPNGHEKFVVLPKFKILKTWNNTAKTAINEAFPEEWIRKTAIRYISKTTPCAHKLVTAVSVLNEHEGAGASKKKVKPESRLMKRINTKGKS